MASFSTNDFKAGLKVMLDGNPCSILENEYVKPGKGQAFNRVKLRNLRTGKVLEQTFKSGDSLEGAIYTTMANFGILCTLRLLSNCKQIKPQWVMLHSG